MIIECVYKPYNYCKQVKDIEDIWRQLSFSICGGWIYEYCRSVKDREEMWKGLLHCNKHSYFLYDYCRKIKDREEMWRAIVNSTHPRSAEWQYTYCANIKDREEMWQSLARSNDLFWLYLYLTNIKDRPEMVEALKNSTQHDRDKYWKAYCQWVKEEEYDNRKIKSEPRRIFM